MSARRLLGLCMVWVLATLALAVAAQAAPNLVANGELDQAPTRATARVSETGNEAIFELPGELSFGRVVARGADSGRRLANELAVGYTFRASASGRIYGLLIDASDVNVNVPYDITIWFDLKGKIRPEKEYAYSIVSLPADERSQGTQVRMIAPAIWADGELTGAEIDLTWSADDRSADSSAKRGVVRMPSFEYQTGGQYMVLRLPTSFANQLFLERVSLREIDEALLHGGKSRMPTPIRYVEIEDPLERRIGETITSATDSLRNAQNPTLYNWGDVRATALILDALASMGEDLTTPEMRQAMEWLADQEVETVPEVANRVMFMSRYGVADHRRCVAGDLLWLEDAQFEDGGWATVSNEGNEDRGVVTDNVNSLLACIALREAEYAGFDASTRMWRKSVSYWTKAQARDGGYRRMLEGYGGLGEATTSVMTAVGLTGMLISLDMAFAAGSSRCDQYLANRGQLAGIERGLQWIDQYYGEYYKTLAFIDDHAENPERVRLNAFAMQKLVEVSGLTHFAGKDAFRTEAQELLVGTDATTGLFLGGPSGDAGDVLRILAQGAAPVVFQRIIVGGDAEHEYSQDGYHLARYLRTQRTEPVNWRAATIDQSTERLVSVPILYVHVVGPMDWDDQHWRRLRDYCFAGGVVLITIAGDNETEREKVEQGLKSAFGEYDLEDLQADDAVMSVKHQLSNIKGLRVIGNGLKNFVFLTPEDWSCYLNLYQIDERQEVFQFIDNLLEYTLDGEPPRQSFARSTWDTGGATVMEVDVTRLEVGGEHPAYPDLVATLDRSMQSGYRLKVHERALDAPGAEPVLLWLACAGSKPMTAEQRRVVLERIRGGSFLLAEVLSGNPAWVEAFRSELLKLAPGIRLRKMMSNHTVLTGFVAETQGFDVRQVALRQTLREEHDTRPRVDGYVIELDGKEVGAFSTYDLSAGLGYVLYPGCRGLMPRYCRRIATNVLLYAMDQATRDQED